MTSANQKATKTLQISIIVPVYKGELWIDKCLTSLRDQTLPPEQFEIILVFNGPPDASEDIARRFSQENKALLFKFKTSPIDSAPAARNVGAASAEGDYVTWLDCDDWFSAEYLELMLKSARRGVVPMAQIVNVDQNGHEDHQNLINTSILSHDQHLIDPSKFVRGLSFMTCKLIPAWLARSVPFDETLRSGEDVALYARMYTRHPFKFNLIPAFAGAKYYRLMRDESVSRQVESMDFSVTQRLEVIKSLNETLGEARPHASGLVKSFINSQASFIRRFVQSNPAEMQAVIDRITEENYLHFPWSNWHPNVSKLVIAYNFVPYADPGAIVTAKRIRQAAEPVDVILNRMDGKRTQDQKNALISAPYVQLEKRVQTPTFFAGWSAVSAFCDAGLKTVSDWQANHGRIYRDVYSRSMWPASHFLAALVKSHNPGVNWTAEFSDPVRLDTTGNLRTSAFTQDEVSRQILETLEPVDKLLLEENLDVYFWAENLPYILADKILFTNENQLRVMVDYADPRLVPLILEKSTVSNQPTLAPMFYNLETAYVPDKSRVNLGYFGDFYSTRGLDEVIQGISTLPPEKRSSIRLHIFTSNPALAKERIAALVDSENIQINISLPYLKFLSSLRGFDCLIVNDASTSDHHSVNPYLPSKLSDYKGAGVPIWGIFEPGSVLSRTDCRFKSPIGDVDAASSVMEDLINSVSMDRI
ncbi:glycosyltransferase [Arthrobacter sp. CAN_C5]|uniref:glycosyltransferase n=1 Tax=Arthrobacter sp. CAN_C5 TaxID=2760706 RepID=UPI001AEA75E6|nr:glycosyltransferase [Arthrobacter sp. CAN_C5]MBP2216312.1 glycosyltransferase involved in cell wall biosynthesis [Arthrobacter sp. CAN_C5]